MLGSSIKIAPSPGVFGDDVPIYLGNGNTVSILYETADADANALIFVAPEGGATDVPAFIFGDASILNADLTWFASLTEPSLVVVNDAADAYIRIDAGDDAVAGSKGIYFKAAADEDIELLNLSVTGTPRIFWDESETAFALTGAGFSLASTLYMGSGQSINWGGGNAVIVDLAPGIKIQTWNGSASADRISIGGGAATAQVTWSTCLQSGLAILTGSSIDASNSDSHSFTIRARDEGVGLVTVASVVGAADPYFSIGGSQEFKFYNSGDTDLVPAHGKAVDIGVSCNLKRFYSEITLATDNAETDVGLTPAAVILSAAIRVSVEIAGLDSADHHIQLGINGNASKYIDVAQGAAATTISVNKKGKYTFDPTTDTEAAALKLTITGGADQIPTAGKVYVEVIYLDSTNLADV